MRHNQSFKNLILDYPRDALAFFAADEAERLAPDARITLLRQEQLSERLGERFREEGLQEGQRKGLQQGLKQGLEQGLERGQRQGEATVLLRLLEHKFGVEQTAACRARIEQADAETLLAWSERILTAARIEDVLDRP